MLKMILIAIAVMENGESRAEKKNQLAVFNLLYPNQKDAATQRGLQADWGLVYPEFCWGVGQ